MTSSQASHRGRSCRRRLAARLAVWLLVLPLWLAADATVRGDEPALAPVEAPAESGPVAVPPHPGTSRATGTAGDRLASLPGLPSLGDLVPGGVSNRSIDGIVSAVLVFGVASLAPAILLMTTSFVRMSVVLSLVRQGLGTPGLPSNQIVTSLALFLSLSVMWPVWTVAYREGVVPLQEGRIDVRTAFERGGVPVRRWMANQIEAAGNRQTMLMFLSRHPSAPRDVRSYDDVPLETLLPAFLVSELETAFSIGVRILIPFLVLDILVAVVLASTGLGTVSPASVALPLKLVVFVMADGWSLVVQSLLDGMRIQG